MASTPEEADQLTRLSGLGSVSADGKKFVPRELGRGDIPDPITFYAWLDERRAENAFVNQERPSSAFNPEGTILTLTVGDKVVSWNAKGLLSQEGLDKILAEIRRQVADL